MCVICTDAKIAKNEVVGERRAGSRTRRKGIEGRKKKKRRKIKRRIVLVAVVSCAFNLLN